MAKDKHKGKKQKIKGRTIDFRDFVRKSPFKPLQNHMALAVQCAQRMPHLIELTLAGDKDALEKQRAEIHKLEDEADGLKEEIRARVPPSVYLPVSRGALLDVLEFQEEIADTARDVANLLAGLAIDIPQATSGLLSTVSQQSAETCDTAGQMISMLSDLVETGFEGPDVDRINDKMDEVVAKENKVDETELTLNRTLFENRDAMDPVSLVYLHKLVGMIADLSNHADELCTRTRLLINK